MEKLGIYIHIPFCKVKCSYCHFYTFAGRLDESPLYFDALQKELESYIPQTRNYSISTIYVGGGTPSLVKEKYISKLIKYTKKNFNIETDCEITIEANPESITKEKLNVYSKAGVNRISIGLQAWQNNLLKYLNRLYTINKFNKKLKIVHESNIKNINLDLIFGIPGQTFHDWQESIQKIIQTGVQHISCYSLELDNNSHFGNLYRLGKFKPADEILDRKMYWYTVKTLSKNGYKQYEISNFCKEGYESKHNLSFWHGIPYIGIGAAAHSHFQGKRYNNIYSIEGYTMKSLKGENVKENIDLLTKKKRIVEYMLLRLRLNKGINKKDFNKSNEEDINKYFKDELNYLSKKKLISNTNRNITLTRTGKDLYNEVIMTFL